MRKTTILGAVFVASAAVACSGGDTEPPAETGGSPAAGGEQGCEAPVETATIQIANFAFEPDCIELPRGTTTLAIDNTDDTDHTFSMPEVQLNEGIDPGRTSLLMSPRSTTESGRSAAISTPR